MDFVKSCYAGMILFTRIPLPSSFLLDRHFNKAINILPIIGCLLGFLSVIVFYLLQIIVSENIAILFTLIFSTIITGALHEDGLADTADALFGGYTQRKRQQILKDSRLGTFGVLALIFIFFTKWHLLDEFNLVLPLIFLFLHVLSRMTLPLIFLVCKNKMAKSGRMSGNIEFETIYFIVSIIIATSILCFFLPLTILITLLLIIFSFSWLISAYFYQKIGIINGDCLGAIQQFSEILILLFFVVTQIH